MQITFTIDTSEPKLSDVDARILRTILGDHDEEIGIATPASTPAKKAASKPAAATKKKPEPVADDEDDEDVQEPEADEDEDEEEEAPAKSGPTLDDAIARATAMVADGKSADVKKALTDLKVKRVSELKPTMVKKFLAALED